MKKIILSVLGLSLMVSSCRDTVIFTTRTGIALDLDTQPTTIDAGFIRSEGILAPIFEGGEVLPVLSSVGSGTKGLGLASDHSFATGDASIIFSDSLLEHDRYEFGEEWKLPDKLRDGIIRVPKGQNRSLFFFGTDTSLGLHVQWTAATLPTGVSLGWKRKELAIVPLMEKTVWVLESSTSKKEFSNEQIQFIIGKEHYINPRTGAVTSVRGTTEMSVSELKEAFYLQEFEIVKLASLLATAAGSAKAGDSTANTGITAGQTYATGDAATLLATHGAVRRVLASSLAPTVVQAQAGIDLSSASLGDLSLLASIDHFIKSKAGDPLADEISKELDSASTAFDFAGNTFVAYQSYAAANNVLTRSTLPSAAVTQFAGVIGYSSRLSASIKALETARNANPNGTINEVDGATTTNRATSHFDAEILKQTKIHAALSKALKKNTAISDAIDYITSNLNKSD